MNWIIGLAGLGIGLILAFIGGVWLFERYVERKENQRRTAFNQRIHELVSSNWQNNTALQEEILRRIPEAYRGNWVDQGAYVRLAAIGDQIRGQRERDTYLPKLLKLHGNYLQATDRESVFKALVELRKCLHNLSYDECGREFRVATNLGLDEVEQLLRSMVHEHAETLLAEARQGSRESFQALAVLRHDCDRHKVYSDFAPLHEWLPADWNDLVALHVANPHLRDFSGVRDMPTGEARRQAAEALRDQNLAEAKIVLAWCNFSSNIRVEVGDVLTADLAKFVASEAKRRSPTQG